MWCYINNTVKKQQQQKVQELSHCIMDCFHRINYSVMIIAVMWSLYTDYLWHFFLFPPFLNTNRWLVRISVCLKINDYKNTRQSNLREHSAFRQNKWWYTFHTNWPYLVMNTTYASKNYNKTIKKEKVFSTY